MRHQRKLITTLIGLFLMLTSLAGWQAPRVDGQAY